MSAAEILAGLSTKETPRFMSYRDFVPPPEQVLIDAVLMGVV